MSIFDWIRTPVRKTATELLRDARRLAAQGNRRDALRAYSKIKRGHLTGPILLEIAQLYLSDARHYRRALDYAYQLLILDPACVEAICVQGEVLLRDGDLAEALARFRKALWLSPECVLAKRRIDELSAPLSVTDTNLPATRRYEPQVQTVPLVHGHLRRPHRLQSADAVRLSGSVTRLETLTRLKTGQIRGGRDREWAF